MTIFPAIESCKPSAKGTGGIRSAGEDILPLTAARLCSAGCVLSLFHVYGSLRTWFCMVCKDKGWLYSVPFVRSDFLPYPLYPKNMAYTEITNAEQLLERLVLHEISLEYPWGSVCSCFRKRRIKSHLHDQGIPRCFCHARVAKDLLMWQIRSCTCS